MGKEQSEKGISCGSRSKVPVWFNMAWTSRGVSASINAVLILNLTYYCTDILGLNATVVGIMLIASKVIDAATDLCAGYIIDHTHTKWGKARPYEICIIFQWLFTVFLFNVPSMGATGQYIWIFIMYVLINAVCTTMLGAADSVYMSRVFTTQKNQIGAMSFNGTIVYILSIIFTIVFPQFLAGAGTTQAGWSTMSFTLAIPLALIGILRFVFCKEVVKDSVEKVGENAKNPKQNLSMKTMLGALSKNKYIFIVVGLMLLTNIVNNMSAATTYYFKYIVQNIGLQSLISMAGMATPLFLIIFPALSKKFGTTKLLRAFLIIGVIGIAIRAIGGVNVATLMIGSLFMGIGTMPISIMINTYLIDCMDYGEWKTGTRVEGLVASVANFVGKLGSAIASGLIGFIMGMAGYDGSLAVQSQSANTAIVVLFNILPIAFFILMIVLAFMYNIDSIRPQMTEDLAKKHEM